ncbi:arsenite efflux transporter metallochaperone ArsD [Alicyclobacillus sp. SO9]|uniref:arsenite efflux transporter metallochaperone ArsD n=1 Tax=Alicyclobacillus sp. SO9 TaxID=2665646 RepID=UPI0018E6F453|nr:arsenite efflux transporter metallochaperone ArsD [Alicyclobacillus sp. SO9]QQE78314.1 arsenite efflux transporter metallochaperone ArsD [Alicyclobacillus sp. SO9]
MRIDFFDPEMCCSTGVCGTSPDRELIRVGELVEKLKGQGHTVERHMMSSDTSAFTSNRHVYETMLKEGMSVLPIVTVDGGILTKGRYPNMDELLATKES